MQGHYSDVKPNELRTSVRSRSWIAKSSRSLIQGGQSVRNFARSSPVGALGGAILALLVIVGIFAPFIAPYQPLGVNLEEKLLPPSTSHLFGTDHLGRDVFSRTIYGTRISLLVGLVVVGIAGTSGVAIGLLGGYLGGIVDLILMRITDMFMAFPSLILAMAFAAALGPSLFNVMIAVSMTSWTGYARLVRSMALSIKMEDYVTAAKAVGVSQQLIIIRHVLPNAITPVLVLATLQMGMTILIASGLGFLGLGVQPPTPEWGAMISDGRAYMTTHLWVGAFPGLAILLACTGFNLFGDGLRDVLDPRLRGRI